MDWPGLIANIKDGDPAAGPRLIDALAAQLDLYCRSIAPDLSQIEQEDAVEKALCKVIAKIDRYDADKATLPTWARGFVRNEVREVRRRDVREIPTGEPYVFVDLDFTQARDDRETEIPNDRGLALVAVLLCLDPGDADLLYAHVVEALPFQTIADRLGAPSAAALRKRYQRAREKVLALASADDVLKHLLKEEAS